MTRVVLIILAATPLLVLLGSANQTEAVRANMEKRAPRFAEAG